MLYHWRWSVFDTFCEIIYFPGFIDFLLILLYRSMLAMLTESYFALKWNESCFHCLRLIVEIFHWVQCALIRKKEKQSSALFTTRLPVDSQAALHNLLHLWYSQITSVMWTKNFGILDQIFLCFEVCIIQDPPPSGFPACAPQFPPSHSFLLIKLMA